MKLNLSTEVFFTLTSSLNDKPNVEKPEEALGDLVSVASSTVATVLKQGRRQSETVTPEYKSTKEMINYS